MDGNPGNAWIFPLVSTDFLIHMFPYLLLLNLLLLIRLLPLPPVSPPSNITFPSRSSSCLSWFLLPHHFLLVKYLLLPLSLIPIKMVRWAGPLENHLFGSRVLFLLNLNNLYQGYTSIISCSPLRSLHITITTYSLFHQFDMKHLLCYFVYSTVIILQTAKPMYFVQRKTISEVGNANWPRAWIPWKDWYVIANIFTIC